MFTACPLGLSSSLLGRLVNSLAASGQLSCNFPLLYFMLLLAAAPLAVLSSATLSGPGVFSLLTPQLSLSQCLQVPNTVLKTRSQCLLLSAKKQTCGECDVSLAQFRGRAFPTL